MGYIVWRNKSFPVSCEWDGWCHRLCHPDDVQTLWRQQPLLWQTRGTIPIPLYAKSPSQMSVYPPISECRRERERERDRNELKLTSSVSLFLSPSILSNKQPIYLPTMWDRFLDIHLFFFSFHSLALTVAPVLIHQFMWQNRGQRVVNPPSSPGARTIDLSSFFEGDHGIDRCYFLTYFLFTSPG